MLWILASLLCIIGLGVIITMKQMRKSSVTKEVDEMISRGRLKTEDRDETIASHLLSIPSFVTYVLIIGALGSFGLGIFNQVFFYAEPGFVYHVRTITGSENVVDDVGYNMYLFGRIDPWKKAMTITAGSKTVEGGSSVSLPVQNLLFLDNVDANASATARFRIPTDKESFLRMAHEYRSPDNLLRSALIPAFEETLDATGKLMSAEEYYQGASTEFLTEFEGQLKNGIYLVQRHEVNVNNSKTQTSTADASQQDQDLFGDNVKTTFEVIKQLDDTGKPIRKSQNFATFGIQVVEARVTDMKPNEGFKQRMQLKQKASADRAIAREQKIQEEEQRLLAIAKGDRQVAEEQATMKVVQMKVTTTAETAKKKAIIAANLKLEQAEIDRQTSEINLAKQRIDAEAVKVTADANAYAKEKVLLADNALAQKLEAEVQIQQIWAEAYAKRLVPQYVFGGGSDVPVGADDEVGNFMKLMTVDAAKRLNYDRGLSNPSPVAIAHDAAKSANIAKK